MGSKNLTDNYVRRERHGKASVTGRGQEPGSWLICTPRKAPWVLSQAFDISGQSV